MRNTIQEHCTPSRHAMRQMLLAVPLGSLSLAAEESVAGIRGSSGYAAADKVRVAGVSRFADAVTFTLYRPGSP